MLFSQLDFWFFFAIVFALYLVLPLRGQNRMLLVASYIFYGAWDWRFLLLIGGSTLINHALALRIHNARAQTHRWHAMMASVVINLGILGVFKYLNFFIDSFIALGDRLGMDLPPSSLTIILPVGVSFFTFQTLSYTIDIYRRRLKPARNVLDFALFVAFFPQLVAGPIERASHLLPEICAPRRVTWDGLSRGAILCLIGLIKKVVIADAISPSVDAVYANPDPSGGAVILATWLFAVQIYCDFSGYTDIARGVARMLGFTLMRNFAQPYFSTTPQEFWRRWHISLSTWLRDYLYIALGGNRKSSLRTKINLMATMVLGGLWHGAAWNFVLWGAYQGGLLVGHRQITPMTTPAQPGPSGRMAAAGRALWHCVKVALFFQIICYGWLLFRADSFGQVANFTAQLFTTRLSDFTHIPMPPCPRLHSALWHFC
ncbi:hypothetical protein BFP70_05215 [Thioclava sp. SK-1]|uniref:MBOAT family O-acyltransferase n=1 Tax=Thioclava sp. SK-1 TaxID=1889770 RepID=UPI0008257B80|nr:MBOAT family O-acyltransferase [Thioclava sp. SK-1]OCX66422.1 hypothetical protein BFP70_05215 [Thioclava sp. SK-1]